MPTVFPVIVREPNVWIAKNTGKVRGCVEVQLGVLPLVFSRLVAPTNIIKGTNDDFFAMFALTLEQRQEILTKLVPGIASCMDLMGLHNDDPKKKLPGKFSTNEIKAVLQSIKLKQDANDETVFKLSVASPMAWFNSEEPGDYELKACPPILGPDNNPIDNLRFSKGTEALVTFKVNVKVSPKDGKLSLPFQLEALKIVKPVFFVPSDSAANYAADDFSEIESQY